MSVIIGAKIVKVRSMTAKEMKDECWEGRPATAIELDNGIILYPSRDEEGNGPGALFGKDDKDQAFGLTL